MLAGWLLVVDEREVVARRGVDARGALRVVERVAGLAAGREEVLAGARVALCVDLEGGRVERLVLDCGLAWLLEAELLDDARA